MARYHILNGDCLAYQLKETNINQDLIIFRECLIDGPVLADNIAAFWTNRTNFIADSYSVPKAEYYRKTVKEINKLHHLPDHSEICLWFENDLFCQTNMWFVISMVANHSNHKLFRVFPKPENESDVWKGFGIATAKNLEQAYNSKIEFSADDIELGKNLWAAYQHGDFARLKKLAKTPSACFEYLEEVCQAHIDRFPADLSLGRPERLVKEIIETKSEEFQVVYSEFADREGIYGFGDLQIKTIYDKQMFKN